MDFPGWRGVLTARTIFRRRKAVILCFFCRCRLDEKTEICYDKAKLCRIEARHSSVSAERASAARRFRRERERRRRVASRRGAVLGVRPIACRLSSCGNRRFPVRSDGELSAFVYNCPARTLYTGSAGFSTADSFFLFLARMHRTNGFA